MVKGIGANPALKGCKMGESYLLKSPLRLQGVYGGKRRGESYTMSLNLYRNAHYQYLNKSKIIYKNLMRAQIVQLPKMDKIMAKYTIFANNRGLLDVPNFGATTEKYFADALVEFGIIKDDSYLYYLGNHGHQFGGIDAGNGRVEIVVMDYSDFVYPAEWGIKNAK